MLERSIHFLAEILALSEGKEPPDSSEDEVPPEAPGAEFCLVVHCTEVTKHAARPRHVHARLWLELAQCVATELDGLWTRPTR